MTTPEPPPGAAAVAEAMLVDARSRGCLCSPLTIHRAPQAQDPCWRVFIAHHDWCPLCTAADGSRRRN